MTTDDPRVSALRIRRLLPPGLAFALRFFTVLLLCSLGFWAFSLHEHLGPVQRAIAATSAVLARAAGGSAVAHGQDIAVHSLIMTVNHECTGIFVVMLFASFVLAYPASWRARLGGLGVGIPLFFAVNVLRLATLARIVEVYPDAFFYLHEYVWQGILTVVVLVGAIAWAEKYG
jgi:exosortase/archaeosortase family protein